MTGMGDGSGSDQPTAASTHQCPGRTRKFGPDERCPHQVPFHMFACKAHWFTIPQLLRARLWREWDENPGEDSYFAVRAECLAAVGVPVDEIADENGGVPLGGGRSPDAASSKTGPADPPSSSHHGRRPASETSGGGAGTAAKEPEFWACDLRLRFDPPEQLTHALLEKDNVIEILRRAGYDVEPMGLRERT